MTDFVTPPDSNRGHGSTLPGRRQLTKALVAERPRATYGNCVYCGVPCYGRTCTYHRDLPQREQQLLNPPEEG